MLKGRVFCGRGKCGGDSGSKVLKEVSLLSSPGPLGIEVPHQLCVRTFKDTQAERRKESSQAPVHLCAEPALTDGRQMWSHMVQVWSQHLRGRCWLNALSLLQGSTHRPLDLRARSGEWLRVGNRKKMTDCLRPGSVQFTI